MTVASVLSLMIYMYEVLNLMGIEVTAYVTDLFDMKLHIATDLLRVLVQL
jgi:hypothetical protein